MHKESAVGDLVTAAQLDIAKKSGYPILALLPTVGGIRADLVAGETRRNSRRVQLKQYNHLEISSK